jgi:hypothetical protein
MIILIIIIILAIILKFEILIPKLPIKADIKRAGKVDKPNIIIPIKALKLLLKDNVIANAP